MSEPGEEQETGGEETLGLTSPPVAIIGPLGRSMHTRHVIAALALAAAIPPRFESTRSIHNYGEDTAQYRGSKSSTNKATKKAAKKARQRNRGK